VATPEKAFLSNW
jgi:hypothetical protein